MESSNVIGQIPTWKKRLNDTVDKALEVYNAQQDAINATRTLNKALGDSVISLSDFYTSGSRQMDNAERTAVNDIKGWLNQVNGVIEKEYKELNVTNVQHMIKLLEECVPIANKLVYSNEIKSMSGVGNIIKDAAENWHRKTVTDKNFKKAVLDLRRKELEKNLEESKTELESSEKKLAEQEEKLKTMLDNYVERKSKTLQSVNDKFRIEVLAGTEEAFEKELSNMNAALQAELELSAASVFRKKAAQEAFSWAKSNYEKAQKGHNDSVEEMLGGFLGLANKYNGYDDEIEEQKKIICSLRNEVKNCRCAVNADEEGLKAVEVDL